MRRLGDKVQNGWCRGEVGSEEKVGYMWPQVYSLWVVTTTLTTRRRVTEEVERCDLKGPEGSENK